MFTPISVCSILFVSLSMLPSQAATSGRFRLQVDGKDVIVTWGADHLVSNESDAVRVCEITACGEPRSYAK